jgi:multidrug transporter EmrE-like cation transporter
LLLAASGRAWAALGYLVVFGSLIGFTAFAYCLSKMPAGTVSTYAYVNPAVAVALGAFVLGEPVGASLLAGASLILAAVLLTTRRPRRGRPRSARPSKTPPERPPRGGETLTSAADGPTIRGEITLRSKGRGAPNPRRRGRS